MEPTGCAIEKTLDDVTGALTQCGNNDCSPTHCTEPNTTLVVDGMGCPRCRNYTSDTLQEVFSCMADRGTGGCGYEQPLEAMHRALDDHPDNVGFVRDNAYLTVVSVTDEDDCSAANPGVFSNESLTQGGVNLGPHRHRRPRLRPVPAVASLPLPCQLRFRIVNVVDTEGDILNKAR
ncbi:MAG: hypothetical protein ABI333_19060 [bacterium]